MCRYSCLFLKKVLQEHHFGEWRIILGEPSLETEGTAQGQYGYQSEKGNWHDHAWLIKKNLIIDITADQFGGPIIYYGGKDTPCYKANIITEADVLLKTMSLQSRVDRWLEDWSRQVRES
jgi:hypothetical protein